MVNKQWHCTCTDTTKTVICVVCAAAMLGYSPWTVYSKAECGDLPSVPMSRRHRVFLRESLAYWIKNHETGLS